MARYCTALWYDGLFNIDEWWRIINRLRVSLQHCETFLCLSIRLSPSLSLSAPSFAYIIVHAVVPKGRESEKVSLLPLSVLSVLLFYEQRGQGREEESEKGWRGEKSLDKREGRANSGDEGKWRQEKRREQGKREWEERGQRGRGSWEKGQVVARRRKKHSKGKGAKGTRDKTLSLNLL